MPTPNRTISERMSEIYVISEHRPDGNTLYYHSEIKTVHVPPPTHPYWIDEGSKGILICTERKISVKNEEK